MSYGSVIRRIARSIPGDEITLRAQRNEGIFTYLEVSIIASHPLFMIYV